MVDPENPPKDKPDSRLLLRFIITAAAISVALVHAIDPHVTVDSTTVFLLVFAAAPWLQPIFKSIELLGMKIELQELKESVLRQTRNLDLIEKNANLPGSPTDKGPGDKRSEKPSAAESRTDSTPDDDSWNDDPNQGKFGGSPEANGRRLSATIRPATDERSAGCEVTLSVTSTDPARPLSGVVTLHLHPTFGRWRQYNVDVKDGVAKDTIVSWGAFTVGAVADKGRTRLELNLASVPGGTRKFYRN